MSPNNKDVLKTIFEKLYGKDNREKVELLITRIKSRLENLAGVDAFVTARVKSPISIIKKFQSEDVYMQEWNKMKDLVGLMIVVEKNSDVDDVIFHLMNEYSNQKNPNAKSLYKDYRVTNIRVDHASQGSNIEADKYDSPSDKGYQICDGYKNVRVNLMIDGYPIEIQVKTKEQYVAHEATHDPIYKAPSIENAELRQEISDKLFPYFEANAHMIFHMDDMSAREKELWSKDVQQILNRNKEFYEKYEDIYHDACRVYAYYLFMTNNMQEIYKDATLGNTSLDLKLLEIEVKRIFHYLEKEIASNNTSLSSGEVFNSAIYRIANMSYEEFLKTRNEIAGSYRCEKCIVSGVYDLLRAKDVELFKRLSESFRIVEVAVYDDELAEIFAGKPPMFSLNDRQNSLRSLRGISLLQTVDISGKMVRSGGIEFMSLNPFDEKRYTVNVVPNSMEELLSGKQEDKQIDQLRLRENTFEIGYLPGVFDMLHPGHVEYISQVCRLCKKVYVGSKSDQYVRIIKGKTPVLEFDERMKILKSIRGIEDVLLTEFDITPPQEIFYKMIKEISNGKHCAIFMGADWIDKPERKNERSIREFENLVNNFSQIMLVSVPRGNSGRSSTSYKEQGLKSKGDVNPYEFTFLDK